MNWLITLLLVPAIGAVVVALLPKDKPDLAKQIALGFSMATMVLVIAMALQFDGQSTEPFQFVTSTCGRLHRHLNDLDKMLPEYYCLCGWIEEGQLAPELHQQRGV
jgi:hypothetical protein